MLFISRRLLPLAALMLPMTAQAQNAGSPPAESAAYGDWKFSSGSDSCATDVTRGDTSVMMFAGQKYSAIAITSPAAQRETENEAITLKADFVELTDVNMNTTILKLSDGLAYLIPIPLTLVASSYPDGFLFVGRKDGVEVFRVDLRGPGAAQAIGAVVACEQRFRPETKNTAN